MNNKFTKSIFLVFSVLTLLVLSSTFSLANIGDTYQKKISMVSKNIVKSSLFSENCIQTLSTDDFEKIISNQTYAEYLPSLVVSGKNVLVAYETLEGNNSKVYFKTSTDNGKNWSQVTNVNATFEYEINNTNNTYNVSYNLTFPSFTKQTTNGDYFGAFLTPDNSSYIIELSESGLNNIALWDYTNITINGSYAGDFYDFKTPDLISYSHPVVTWIIAAIGKGDFIEEYDELDCNDSPMFFYKDVDSPSSSRTIVFFPEVSGCSNISICLGENNIDVPMVYGTCEIKNNLSKDLLFFYGNTDIWGNPDEPLLRKIIIPNSQNLTHPKIYAKQNNIYIVAKTSSKEIVMYSSNNYGSNGSWILKNVTHDILALGSEPIYPDIYVSDENIFCSFVESGNLTVTSSNNSGVSWKTPYKINTVDGSVVGGYHYQKMATNHNFVWTDNRKGNFDIYYYVDYVPTVDLELVNISLVGNLEPLKTKNYLQITVKNKGDATARSIKMNVTFSFITGNDTYPDNIFEIDALLPGKSINLSREIFYFKIPDFFYAFISFAGINGITVKVDPEGLTGDIDTSNNYMKKAFSYNDIFPILGKYDRIEQFILDNNLKGLVPS